MTNYQCGIYEIINKLNGDFYIGQTINLVKRQRNHLYYLKNRNHRNRHLQMAFNKYGEDNFSFKIILLCELYELNHYEQKCVDLLNPKYNIRRECVSSNFGLKRSDEVRKKMSQRLIGNKRTLGKKASDETKKKLSQILIGNKRTLGYHKSPETIEKISGENSSLYKIPRSEEMKIKISNKLLGHNVSIETRDKIGKANSNPSNETRLKISESLKLYFKSKKRNSNG